MWVLYIFFWHWYFIKSLANIILKQSHKQWYMKFDSFIISCGFFKKYELDNCVYFNMLIMCKNRDGIEKVKFQLNLEFWYERAKAY